MPSHELGFLSAVELAAMIRTRKVSPVEVMREMLARIERLNPALNAFVTVQAEEAKCSAAKAEDAVMRGECLGPLHGVPLHVKDNLFIAGSRTTFGSKLMETNVTSEDCPAVERLRKAGMIVVGRTNSPEYGWKGVTDNRVFGITRNPWNTSLTPGGSSGGASAAVAAGLGPIGLGTDGGGSLRIPASFSGVFGFKASFGRIPNWPGSGGAMLRHIGAITRTVADMAVALDVLAGPDPRDLLSLPATGESYSANLDCGIRGKRIAYSSNFGYARVEPEVAAICQRAAQRFAEAGAIVEEVKLDWRDPYDTWSVFFFGTAAASLEKKLPTQGELLDPGLRRVVEQGLKLRGVDFANALGARHDFWEKVRRVYERFDLLLCPTLPVPPFKVGQDDADPLDGETEPLGPLQWTRFTYPFNLTGQPAASVPAGWTKSGLPIGLQLIGNRFADLLVLQAARAWEQIQPWSDRRPVLTSSKGPPLK
ncbi:MAG: aspartyl-tRNA(Asn)/glutamyl-tRNA (Gln) amidotransferase subunit A [Planctomycetota bacterium]|nr:MAG: aspartyl-tRNA(Asn)/glutamyl-tRNA (Gln) amidotransferase subunit A [Planctomycetota bacterium]